MESLDITVFLLKLIHTEGTHIYMRLQLDDNRIEEIDAYIKESGYTYRTTGDHTPELRNRIIQAFHKLY